MTEPRSSYPGRPLDGITVLDFSTLLPGPFASLTLAEAGARVIRVERPGGEDMRRFPPRLGPTSAPFAALNRGKACIVVDLKSEHALDLLTPAIQEADILIEQFRPGVMDRLGFGPLALRAINPRLIYCSITGYGQTGPRALEAGHDLTYQALGGLLAQSLQAGGLAPLPPPLVADLAGGSMPAVINILLALRQRDRTGEGCHLDIAMADSAATFAWYALARGEAEGRFPEGGEGLLTGASPRYRIYRTADGWFLAVGALEDKFWHAFTAAIGLAPEFCGTKTDAAAIDAVTTLIGAQSAAYWRALLEPLDCCCAVVRRLEEAVNDPHFQGRGLWSLRAQVATGEDIAAACVPLAPVFRERALPIAAVDGEEPA
jgi:crotonobetainyl-CoA:carnitine CoA-transferase CaiB-like acyl-CoA transferase